MGKKWRYSCPHCGKSDRSSDLKKGKMTIVRGPCERCGEFFWAILVHDRGSFDCLKMVLDVDDLEKEGVRSG